MKMILSCLSVLTVIVPYCIIFIVAEAAPKKSANYAVYDDYKIHPCKRDCNQPYQPMECVYNFTADWYTSMNEECGNCPFNITDCYRKNCAALNGKKRAIMTINHIVPGPAIEICQGDTVVVNLHNKLRMVDGTSIHWHGLLQRRTQHMDGVPMITQCPIMEGDYFQYKFPVEDYGTFLWHSHSIQQRTDGIVGALIIRQNRSSDPLVDLFDYDLSEHVILINDWFNQTFLATQGPHVPDIAMLDSDAILINGRGVLVDFYDQKTNQVYQTPRSVFKVDPGKRYRFRLISSGITSCPMKISIEGHDLKVIATDGQPILPVNVKSIMLHSGERYDFIVTADQAPKDYVITVEGYSMCENLKQTAILSYNKPLVGRNVRRRCVGPLCRSLEEETKTGIETKLDPMGIGKDFPDFFKKHHKKTKLPAETEAQTTTPTSTTKPEQDLYNQTFDILNPYDLTTLINKTSISVAQLRARSTKRQKEIIRCIKNQTQPIKKIYLNIEAIAKFNNEYPLERYTYQWQNISNKAPPIPILFDFDLVPKNQICNGFDRSACKNDTNICSCTHLYQLELNEVVEIIIVDLDQYKVFPDDSVHMFHLHGYKFAVLASEIFPGQTTFEQVQEMDRNGKLTRNLNNPPLKDTTVVLPGGYTILRFVADNPGVWFFHCHTEFHMETGLSGVFRVGQTQDLPVQKPKAWPECGNFKYNLKNKLFF